MERKIFLAGMPPSQSQVYCLDATFQSDSVVSERQTNHSCRETFLHRENIHPLAQATT